MSDHDAVDAGLARHEEALREIWRLIRITRNSPELTENEKRALLERLYAPLSTKDVQGFFIGDAARYGIGVSFRSSMQNLMRFKASLRREGLRIAPGANSKLSDRRFGQALGVPVPETLQREVALRDVQIVPRSILKPVNGESSRGVAHVDADGRIMSIASGRVYNSIADGEDEFPHFTPSGKEVKWIVEQVIYGEDGRVANDLKAFMFYGQPGAVLEVARNRGGASNHSLYCTYDPNGREIDFYRGVDTFSGSGLPADLLDKARVLSLASPVPFLRIDFYRGVDRCYLGEITPHPGRTYARGLDEQIDKKMGHLYHDAEARLFKDLLQGKQFPEYFQCYESGLVAERKRDTFPMA